MTTSGSEPTQAETQVLVVVSFLEQRSASTDTAAAEAFGGDYFGMYRVDWGDAVVALMDRGLLSRDGERLRLTSTGAPVAEHCRAAHPKALYFYNEYFTRALASPAHARFCEAVYGRDLCQHGMMDMAQLDALVAALDLRPDSSVLDVGCGNGMAAEYISDTTGARVTGLDISTVGIAQALERTADRRERLDFIAGDMSIAPLPDASFDAVVAADSFYFAADLDALLARLRHALRPGGRIAAFWSTWTADPAKRALLAPDRTRLALALAHGCWRYRTLDLTAQELAHWRCKLAIIRGMEADFAAEGNLFLYRKRRIEAEQHQAYVDCNGVSRYLYCATCPESAASAQVKPQADAA
jgi:SAM-dependent methyltransferase